MATMASDADTPLNTSPAHSVLNSSFPVFLPRNEALLLPEDEFQALIKQEITARTIPNLKELKDEIVTIDTLAAPESVSNRLKRRASVAADNDRAPKAPFVVGLEKHHAHHQTAGDLALKNKALTENLDVTNISSNSPIVDLFYDLGQNMAVDKLKMLLEAAWSEDAALTLKIIFNARSIHLGKSNRVASYKAFGWLAENHPITLLTNLPWLVRPIIPKKAPKAEGPEAKAKNADEDFDIIDADNVDPTKTHDVQFGVSHGYWKDLLNLVVFAANDQLKVDGDPASLMNQHADNSKEGKRKRNWDQATAKAARQQQKKEQNERVQVKLNEDPFYRALHFTVARLFAAQLKEDKALLDAGKKPDLKKLSLVAKWAPTFGEFHDKHTFIQSSIAEILYPEPALHCPDGADRELYLRHIREHFRKQYASPLRKALSVVERDIAANKFDNIKYERVPSLAMDRYTELFMKKDYDRFQGYIQDVAKGTAKISGATLLPSTVINKAQSLIYTSSTGRDAKDFKAAKAAAERKILGEVVDGQWNTLVQRVRDAGTLQSSIAICDVSGSMSGPRFKDGSCPMDSAIGLSLLIAEVTAPPFGGGFISFSESPAYLSINKDHGLVEKLRYITNTPWGFNTNFVAVFEDIILPMAISNKLKQEDMVKQVFVFSDMQFDSAQENASDRWTTSFERIKNKYADAGYEVPRLIFWNLADGSTSKPTTMKDTDTTLVSGYSQGMLRALLESGAFDDEEELIEEVLEEGEDGVMEVKKVKKKTDPLTVVKKTVSHQAYSMLQVLD
jgi:hypothetical protein